MRLKQRTLAITAAAVAVIGQAKGMLMERFDVDAAAAFGLLRRCSQESNVPVAQIAQQVVAGDHPSR